MLKTTLLRLALAGSLAGAVLTPSLAAPIRSSKLEPAASTATVETVVYRNHRHYRGGYGRGHRRGGYYGHGGYRGRGYGRY